MNWLSLDEHKAYLCLQDLIKMQHLLGFDITERYRGLAKLYKNTLGWKDDFEWVSKVLKKLKLNENKEESKEDQ